jgi:hypothetical protein
MKYVKKERPPNFRRQSQHRLTSPEVGQFHNPIEREAMNCSRPSRCNTANAMGSDRPTGQIIGCELRTRGQHRLDKLLTNYQTFRRRDGNLSLRTHAHDIPPRIDGHLLAKRGKATWTPRAQTVITYRTSFCFLWSIQEDFSDGCNLHTTLAIRHWAMTLA